VADDEDLSGRVLRDELLEALEDDLEGEDRVVDELLVVG